MYDVLVAGAGPAGSAAALLLEREGLSVGIVEPAAFPRTKVCGEYLSAASVRELNALGVAARVKTRAEMLDDVRITSGGAHAILKFSKPGWSLERATLDAAILAAARTAGAQLQRGRVEDLQYEANGLAVMVRDDRGARHIVRCRALIGADGARSSVARLSGLEAAENGPRRFAIGGHYENLSGLGRSVHMFVDGRTYLAVNPLGDSRANVMLIVYEDDLRSHRENVDEFVRSRAAELSQGRIDLKDAWPSKRVATGPLAHRTRRFTAPGILLAGDAAQFVDPFTGQGVYLALHAARLACNALRDTLVRGIREPEAWRRYERGLQAEISRRSRYAAMASFAVRTPVLAPFAQLFSPLLDAVSA